MPRNASSHCQDADDDRPLAIAGPYGPAILRCGYHRTNQPQQITVDRPNSYRMLGVQDGTAVLTQDHQPDQTFTPGEVMLLLPGGSYRLQLAGGSQLIRLTFDVVYQPRQGQRGNIVHIPPAARQPSPARVWGVDLPTRIPKPMASQCMLVLELIRSEHWQRPAVYARACGRLGLLLGELAAEASAPRQEDPASRGYWSGKIERLLQSHLASLPTTAQAAEALGISREHLSRCYRQETGMTLSFRLREERWRRATDMLAYTDTPIATIALHVGYRRPEAFAHAFVKARGLTPSAFRRKAHQSV
ncbi:MAG: helix-turn-helix domain-containing protein [Phycisphaerae bacterium]